MELCNIGSLTDMAIIANKQFTEKQIAFVTRECLAALDQLHALGIIHRDIKARNIMVHDHNILIGDFGVSEFEKNAQRKRYDIAGTPLWMAPEMLSGEGHTYKADIWSLGITVIELAEGLPPHWDLEPEVAYKEIVDGPSPTLNNPSAWSSKMRHFLASCLLKDPRVRPCAKKLLSHPFVQISRSPGQGWHNISDWLAATKEIRKVISHAGKSQAMGKAQDDGAYSFRGVARKSREAPWSRTVKKSSVKKSLENSQKDSVAILNGDSPLWENEYSLRFLSNER
eukprot:TRINITY_DN16895_c0_g1_i1.p1 TRINITY_DN16895_c0_g1~~TRINITY_DN16895_c0_g1_i1.p1  ORF type:complete len:283 (-),score=67.66 TRINITY_DN16895_c0_g1_i1:108-956(-)